MPKENVLSGCETFSLEAVGAMGRGRQGEACSEKTCWGSEVLSLGLKRGRREGDGCGESSVACLEAWASLG